MAIYITAKNYTINTIQILYQILENGLYQK